MKKQFLISAVLLVLCAVLLTACKQNENEESNNTDLSSIGITAENSYNELEAEDGGSDSETDKGSVSSSKTGESKKESKNYSQSASVSSGSSKAATSQKGSASGSSSAASKPSKDSGSVKQSSSADSNSSDYIIDESLNGEWI